MWDKIKEIISPIAPIIAGALGSTGPIGMGAAIALKAALTGNEDATDEELNQAVLTMTPEQKATLTKMDNDFKVQMRQLDIQEEGIYQQDRDSARNRDIKLAEAGHRDYVPSILAIGLLAIYAFVQVYAMHTPGTQDDMIASRIQDLLLVIITFYFGSSWSSRKKDNIIQELKK